MATLLQVTDLSTHFILPRGTVKAVDAVSFSLKEGESLAIVGESGCGKSVSAFSVMGLVPPPGRIVAGEVLFGGHDLLRLTAQQMQELRGNSISMIFQEPMTSLNPVMTVGFQIAEGLRFHRQLSRDEAREETLDILRQVGIPSPSDRLGAYPHQLSGGMRQRVMIAMALACKPQLLIADEPTTALDVTIQAQILELIGQLQKATRMGLILISHDMGIVAERSDATAVMYAGKIVEYAPTQELFTTPLHPYTVGLLNSLPQSIEPGKPLKTIPGQVPAFLTDMQGCGFCDRCPARTWECRGEPPPFREIRTGHLVRCWKYQ